MLPLRGEPPVDEAALARLLTGLSRLAVERPEVHSVDVREIFAVNREDTPVLGRPTHREVAESPEGRADLVFACTPKQANPELLRACAQ
jgi:hypothetical protein